MSEVPHAVRSERRRVAHLLHGGVVQQITALSLAIDSALFHDSEGRPDQVSAALHTARQIADLTIADCRALLDGLRDGAAADGGGP